MGTKALSYHTLPLNEYLVIILTVRAILHATCHYNSKNTF